MYRYETHLHTSPVSKCASASVRESLEYYKELGYDGVFITNHFINGNLNVEEPMPYGEKLEFYFSDYEKGVEIGREIGIKVFCGVELSYKGTDFLIYGLDKEWYLKNPQIETMSKKEELLYMIESGALVIQAHPFRERSYIDHIRLYPDCVHGVEVINANNEEVANKMAKQYAECYNLLETAGSDNHIGSREMYLAGLESEEPISDEQDFICRVKNRELKVFEIKR